MKASALLFRLRYLLHAVIYALGFMVPWDAVWHVDPTGPNAHTWGFLAAMLSKYGVANIGLSFDLLLGVGILFALLGAGLRTWASGYIGAGVVQDAAMHGDRVVADGPYRRVRNPLYVGTFLHTFALALLMPPSGAIFSIVAIGLVQLLLIAGEEPFLVAKLGASYEAYKAKVPRLLPALTPRVPASGQKGAWPQAFLGEIYFWGVAGSFAVVGWRYNAFLLIKCVVVSLGVSMVARAFVPKKVAE
jgi:protein-S-isoprenylcysteine O-methyltransferase Ste14